MQQAQALAAIDVSLLDSNYAPQDSFFEFVNQKWIESNPIPASKSSWGAFYELREQSLAALKDIHEEAV
jgi:predicted metalloendopeptidase